jgi:hypothetical protein
MFTRQDLDELVTYEGEAPVLSVYLNVDPTERTTDEYRLALRHMIEDIEDTAPCKDVEAIERFFEHEYDWSGRAVAVFSAQEEGFWRAYSMAVPIASSVTVARKPYIWPMVAIWDAYGSYAVVLVGRQEAQFLLFEMGELRARDTFEGDEVRRLKKGRGSSAGPGRRGGAPVSGRHEEEIVQRNMREAAKVAERFVRKHQPQRLILAGADPTVASFRDALSKGVRDKVIGSFHADLGASDRELLNLSLDVIEQAEQKREAALVDAVFTGAAKGRGGVIRLGETLEAAHEGRVQTLVVARGFHRPGYRCQNCGYITDQKLDVCPFCGGQFAEIADAAEALVTKVIEDGGKVEVVDEEEYPKIAEFGVGALVRY